MYLSMIDYSSALLMDYLDLGHLNYIIILDTRNSRTDFDYKEEVTIVVTINSRLKNLKRLWEVTMLDFPKCTLRTIILHSYYFPRHLYPLHHLPHSFHESLAISAAPARTSSYQRRPSDNTSAFHACPYGTKRCSLAS